MKYLHRVLETKLKEYLGFFSVVGITGPKQSGKSTLLLHLLPNYTYVTFDDLRHVNAFYDDPEKFMRIYANQVIFDEVQRVPELFNAIKIAVDSDRQNPGKFVLTGSSQFAFIKGVSESLAGRIGLLTLLPYQFSELPIPARESAVWSGSYPELVAKNYALSQDWYASYVETYLNKDVSALSHIGDMRDFRRLLYLLASNTSQQLNMSNYARDLGVDVKTIKRWISILEASYIVFLLPPYFKNYGKRITKSPKLYFYDTGLVSFLTDVSFQAQSEPSLYAGPLFENYIITEVLKREHHQKTNAELYYYRTSSGDELDLIVDRKQCRDLIEIKSGETLKPKMTSMIETLYQSSDKGYLVYRGKQLPYLEHVRIINYTEFLK